MADARDKTSNRGLTRAEVTFYVDGNIPTDDFIEEALQNIVAHIPATLIYSTPFAEVWRSYCSSFQHSLVCVDRTEDVGLVVYSYNEITGNISGESYEKWSEREKWCLDKLTLNGNLPLDVIDINTTTKTLSSRGPRRKNNFILEIAGSRYYKVHPDSSTRFSTRLVSNKGVDSFNVDTTEENSKRLVRAGLVEHEHCIPYLARRQSGKKSKADAELRKIDTLKVYVEERKATKHDSQERENLLQEEAARLEEIRKPLLEELRFQEIKLRCINSYKQTFTTRDSIPLGNLAQGVYTVHAARKQNTRYGVSHKLLVEVNGEMHVVWGNKKINSTIDSIPKEKFSKMLDTTSGIIAFPEQELATLAITGRGTNSYGHITVYCNFNLKNCENPTRSESACTSKTECEKHVVEIVTQEHLLPYREYNNLSLLPIGSTHRVSALGYAKSYGGERLVIKIGDTFYQAGEDIETKVANLQSDCILKIEKIRANPTRHTKYAICSLYEPGDWTACVDFSKTPMLVNRDGSTCIVDVKTVEVKGKKRKLLLTDKGLVYKLKQSKLENSITPGFL